MNKTNKFVAKREVQANPNGLIHAVIDMDKVADKRHLTWTW